MTIPLYVICLDQNCLRRTDKEDKHIETEVTPTSTAEGTKSHRSRDQRYYAFINDDGDGNYLE